MADDTTETQATAPDAATSQADTEQPTTTDGALGTTTAPAPADPVVSSDDATAAPAPVGAEVAPDAAPSDAPAAPDAPAEPTPEAPSETPAPAEDAPSGGDGSQGTELPAASEPGAAPLGDETPSDPSSEAGAEPAAPGPSEPTSTGGSDGSTPASAPAASDPASDTAEVDQALAADPTPEATPAEGGVGTEQAKADKAPETSKGESAPASGDAEVVPSDTPSVPEPGESAGEGDVPTPAEPEAKSDDSDAAPTTTDAETVGPKATDDAADPPAEKPADAPAPTPVVLTSPMLSDGSIPQHGTNDAPSTDPVNPTTLFGGQSGPSPAPDVDPATILPHPALTENSPGFISGTTQGTQSALPVPGPADAAASTAASLSKAGNTAPGDLPDPTVNTGGLGGTGTDDAAKAGDEAASGASEATSALPVAGLVQDTFKTLSDDGKAIVEALSKVSDDIGDVIALEFKSLANLAAHISGRLDETKRQLTEPEQRMQLVTVANQVMELLQSLQSLFGESADDAPLPPDVEEVIANLGDLGESARDALYSED